jgi:hypothetical protein
MLVKCNCTLVYDENGNLDEISLIRLDDTNLNNETILEMYTDGYFHIVQNGSMLHEKV